MEYVRINNFMKSGQKRIKRNEIIDKHNFDLNDIFMSESKINEVYNSKIDDLSTEMIEFYEDKTCRYCFEGEINDDELISPCLCKGTQKYIHLKCLQNWRSINKDNPEKRDFCEICKYHYVVKNIDYVLKYQISSDISVWFLYSLFIIISSFLYGVLDYYNDFFTTKILSPFSYNSSVTYKRFNTMKKNNARNFNMTTFDYFVYSFFIFDVVSFYINSFYIIYYRKNIKMAKKYPLYKKDIGKKYNTVILFHFSIFFYYYITLIFDEYYILTNMMPVAIVLKYFSIILFLSTHNRILTHINKDNIENEIIYSFEENPLLTDNGRP